MWPPAALTQIISIHQCDSMSPGSHIRVNLVMYMAAPALSHILHPTGPWRAKQPYIQALGSLAQGNTDLPDKQCLSSLSLTVLPWPWASLQIVHTSRLQGACPAKETAWPSQRKAVIQPHITQPKHRHHKNPSRAPKTPSLRAQQPREQWAIIPISTLYSV